MLKKIESFNLLLDFYEPLLTEKQRDIMEMYYRSDLSLSEIAENDETSRSSVHDLISRTEKKLLKFEEKLQLVSKYQKRKEIYDKMLKVKEPQIQSFVKALMDLE